MRHRAQDIARKGRCQHSACSERAVRVQVRDHSRTDGLLLQIGPNEVKGAVERGAKGTGEQATEEIAKDGGEWTVAERVADHGLRKRLAVGQRGNVRTEGDRGARKDTLKPNVRREYATTPQVPSGVAHAVAEALLAVELKGDFRVLERRDREGRRQARRHAGDKFGHRRTFRRLLACQGLMAERVRKELDHSHHSGARHLWRHTLRYETLDAVSRHKVAHKLRCG